MSAVTGLREAVFKHTAFSASVETNAINSGVRGRAPGHLICRTMVSRKQSNELVQYNLTDIVIIEYIMQFSMCRMKHHLIC